MFYSLAQPGRYESFIAARLNLINFWRGDYSRISRCALQEAYFMRFYKTSNSVCYRGAVIYNVI